MSGHAYGAKLSPAIPPPALPLMLAVRVGGFSTPATLPRPPNALGGLVAEKSVRLDRGPRRRSPERGGRCALPELNTLPGGQGAATFFDLLSLNEQLQPPRRAQCTLEP